MRRLAALTIAVAVAASIPAALALGSVVVLPAQPATASACLALQASVGPDTFAKQYPNLGACVSHWARTTSSERLTAQSSCRAKGLTGLRLTACLNARLVASMTKVLRTTVLPIKSCGAELNVSGAAAFDAKYGSSSGLSAAFGRCVLPKTAASAGSAAAGPQSFSLALTASPLNGSGASGVGSIRVNAHGLVLKVALSGAESGQFHSVLLLNSKISCADLALALDQQGTVAMNDGAVLVSLAPSMQSGTPMTVHMSNPLGPFAGRQVVVLGQTVNGSYDTAHPIACGTVSG